MSGIGAETARVPAKRGARLVLPARSVKAEEDTKARIVSEFPDSEIVVMALDLSSLCTSGLQFARVRAPCHFLSSSLITSLVELFNSLIAESEYGRAGKPGFDVIARC
ncbi:hypothetical protein Syun_028434 [Stephania yunnanensis]|uniref:Uncharacterized protein n=1 Tax=Stephania yunnanensis TaxID=152371 RepID=A0AAP0HLX2_9MAGN